MKTNLFRILGGGGFMRLARLMVELTRSSATRNLRAVVIQESSDGPVEGKNILSRCSVRRIATAKSRVMDKLGAIAEDIQFDNQATPDLVRKGAKAQ